jgi:hypothetical protein
MRNLILAACCIGLLSACATSSLCHLSEGKNTLDIVEMADPVTGKEKILWAIMSDGVSTDGVPLMWTGIDPIELLQRCPKVADYFKSR